MRPLSLQVTYNQKYTPISKAVINMMRLAKSAGCLVVCDSWSLSVGRIRVGPHENYTSVLERNGPRLKAAIVRELDSAIKESGQEKLDI